MGNRRKIRKMFSFPRPHWNYEDPYGASYTTCCILKKNPENFQMSHETTYLGRGLKMFYGKVSDKQKQRNIRLHSIKIFRSPKKTSLTVRRNQECVTFAFL